ncbi:MAG: hypothetical protein RBT74_00915 [Tenuifilaceae bacterium]|jgi:hypothetical protein|nr:hypothetical protein [Tenuifilaceae bacterium]
MKKLNLNLLKNLQVSNAEMRSVNGGLIAETIETVGGKDATTGGCVKDVMSIHTDGTFTEEYYEVECP